MTTTTPPTAKPMPSRSSTKAAPAPGVLITPRFAAALALALWQQRQLDKQQIAAWFYPDVRHKPGAWECSLIGRDLRKWVAANLLVARPQPVERPAGRPPLVYALGSEASQLVSQLTNLPLDVVRARQKQDSQLSWLFYLHRHAISDTRIALERACAAAGYTLTWLADEELAQLRLRARVSGKERPVRPDGYFVLEAEHKIPRFLELQLTSVPRTYRLKAEIYSQFYLSGAYEKAFGYRSMRVLAVTDTPARAENLRAAVKDLPHPELFWSTSLPELSEPFGAIWRVPGSATRLSLLGA